MSNKPHNRPGAGKKTAPATAGINVGQLQMSLLNMRQMYEQVVQEKGYLQGQIQQAQTLTIAILLEGNLDGVVINQETLDMINEGKIAGLEITDSVEPKGRKVTLMWAPEEDVPDADSV